jgi:hypothetical protein
MEHRMGPNFVESSSVKTRIDVELRKGTQVKAFSLDICCKKSSLGTFNRMTLTYTSTIAQQLQGSLCGAPLIKDAQIRQTHSEDKLKRHTKTAFADRKKRRSALCG